MSKTTTIQFEDSLDIRAPFLLFVGRNKKLIEKPARFVAIREHLQSENDETGSIDFISPLPVNTKYSLFIDKKLFAETWPTGTRRFSVKFIQPRNSIGPLEIHLVKKYTALAGN